MESMINILIQNYAYKVKKKLVITHCLNKILNDIVNIEKNIIFLNNLQGKEQILTLKCENFKLEKHNYKKKILLILSKVGISKNWITDVDYRLENFFLHNNNLNIWKDDIEEIWSDTVYIKTLNYKTKEMIKKILKIN